MAPFSFSMRATTWPWLALVLLLLSAGQAAVLRVVHHKGDHKESWPDVDVVWTKGWCSGVAAVVAPHVRIFVAWDGLLPPRVLGAAVVPCKRICVFGVSVLLLRVRTKVSQG